jgi:hypothetical protein
MRHRYDRGVSIEAAASARHTVAGSIPLRSHLKQRRRIRNCNGKLNTQLLS